MGKFIGIDPGGVNAFGWCVLETKDSSPKGQILESGVGSGVSEAMAGIQRHFSSADEPIGVGIDAPLYWVAQGDRLTDQKIRKAVSKAGGHPSTVAHVNSLRGACLVQGILATVALVEIWPKIQVTESHPKALLAVWPPAIEFVSRFSFKTEHERDAALGAYSAFAHQRQLKGWKDGFLLEIDPFVPSGSSVAYWFPSE